MSVTDLTLTKWYFNSNVDVTNIFSYNINFISKRYPTRLYSNIFISSSHTLTYQYIENRITVVTVSAASNGVFSNSDDRYITIVGGTDVNNVDLISWLESNAVQQEFELEEYLTNTYDLTQVANAVRGVTKSNILLSYPLDMANALNNMGDYWTIEQLMSTSSLGSLYYNGSRTTIPYGAFAFKNITTASFPNCTSINYYAFYSCSSLTTALFPNCISINSYAFSNCIKLTTISFPNCTSIGSSAFYYCGVLTTASFPNCTYIGSYAFAYCYSLTTISFPSCTTINNGAFNRCSSLTTALFLNCTSIGDSAFQSCISLTIASFPNCTSIGNYAFRSCYSLSNVSFPNCTSIGNYTFDSCYNLTSLNLTGVSVVTSLPYSNAFSSTPIAGYSTSAGQYGSIYVPASLYDAFKSATNWTYFSSRMVSV